MRRSAKPKARKSAPKRRPTKPLKRSLPAAPPVLSARFDLSKIRHDLRTPINHILGYCEMLQEDDELPQEFALDLAKIHAGGKQLLVLIAEYFNEETFETKRGDVQRLCHDLRTPVNQIIGYSEILQEDAADLNHKKYVPDLHKIREAAASWLALMEEHLLPAREGEDAANIGGLLPPGITFQSPAARLKVGSVKVHGNLLVVDDDEFNRDMLSRRLQRDG